MEDECWGLKAWVHGMMYDLDEVLLVGDESSYCNRLDVSLMNISGTLETKKGAALAKATVIFYKDIEMQQISGTVVTNEESSNFTSIQYFLPASRYSPSDLLHKYSPFSPFSSL